ncbi:DUF2147 domain-containing protein [Tenacibaculum sp. SG-28]|uniref:DUF2147 domain-containing protein n=1 Tax=Tenacibaculum sp. SG-28 TaxID=754426 RepID=UPI000CF51410|nr:DUF2147 domain-containing protein [Tenacibaculum sp. SG-28]PQJ23487.1 hypothetical protein BSU00_04740 [Tenacibaculum sp. SG-28]
MKKTLFTLALLLFITQANAQSIFGKWENLNEETKEVDSVIEVYEENDKVYAKIIAITDATRQKAVCEKCSGDKKNKPILGMQILSGLQKDGDQWNGGTIVDPKNGKEYKCYIKLEEPNKLKVRGYIGFSAMGRTKYWYRKDS